jgi:hypothetical protein
MRGLLERMMELDAITRKSTEVFARFGVRIGVRFKCSGATRVTLSAAVLTGLQREP